MTMGVTVSRGPVIMVLGPDQSKPLDACFRLLSSYDCKTDAPVTRFDILLNVNSRNVDGRALLPSGDQFNCVVFSSRPVGSLLIPSAGVLGGHSINLNVEDLRDALRGLADAIDGELTK